MAVGYTLRFRTKEGRDKEFETFIRHMVEIVKANDAGCLNYDLYRSVDDPRSFAFFERWASEDDVKAHTGKPHFKEFEKMGEMLEGRPDMVKHAD